MINNPAVAASDYEDSLYIEDSVEASPAHGTTVQAGWDAASTVLTPKKSGDYPTDFRYSEELQLVRFLENEPFAVYEQHWVEKEGKKSYVALGDDDPLTVIAGLKPRPKFAFNVLNLSADQPEVQVLTAPTSLARMLRAANDDPRRGPLTKYYWAISRSGMGPQTTFTLDRVRPSDLEEEWNLSHETVEEVANNAPRYDSSIIKVASHEEHQQIARQLVSVG
jgi:hypothetical protein